MATYDMGKDVPENTLDFLVWRARAIESYAQVEQALNLLFSFLIGSTQEYASVVFFRLTNTHSRNAIFTELITKRHGSQYDAYWHGIPDTPNRRGLMTFIRQLDGRRNEIVHWHTVNEIGTVDDKAVGTLHLGKPNFWSYKSDSPKISVNDMQEFCAKADFVQRSITMFTMTANDQLPDDSPAKSTWREICQQPCIYPPPDNHPLAPKSEAPGSPPQPSGE